MTPPQQQQEPEYFLNLILSERNEQAIREQVLDELKADLQTRFSSSSNQWSKGRNSGLLECCNIIDELRQQEREP